MKPTITKKIMAILGAVMLFASTNIKAQHSASDTLEMRKLKLDYLIKQNPYIFVGKLISSKNFKTTDGAYYSSNLFEVTEVISGNLQKGTVELVEKRYNYTNDKGEMIRNSDAKSGIFNGTTLYFCSDAKASESNAGTTNTNAKTLSIVDGTAFSVDKVTQRATYSLFRFFTTMSDFYTTLSKDYGITVPKSLQEKKSPVSTITSPIVNIPYSEKLKNNENYNKYLQNKANQRKANPNKVSNLFSCTELYISEYLDGAGSDNAVEIYNPTNAAINLSNYKLLLYHNASLTPTTIALTGTISAYSTHVIAETGASSYIIAHSNQTTSSLNFNGDVTTVLNKGTIHIDKIGEIGVANAAGNWTLTPSGGTNNTDIRRKYNIGVGDTNWTNCKAEWDVFSQDSTHNLGGHLNLCVIDPDLNINFANPYSVDSSNGKSYFEFDVTATSVGLNTYLDNAPLHIYYNSAAFGTNIVANGKVTIINGANFNSSTYRVLNMNDYDISPDTLGIGFGADFSASSWSRTIITATPKILMRVFIEVQACNQNADLQFVNLDLTSSPFLTYYVSNQNDNPNTAADNAYTNINYGSNLNYTVPTSVCGGISITDFPSPVLAGVGSSVTIIGTGFGNTRGNGQVKFTNADDGGSTHLHGLNANDYVNWSDTHITITMPSFADTINTPDSTIIGGTSFIVTNNAGQSAFSMLNSANNSFAIYFSLLNVRHLTLHDKNRVNLRQQDTSGGYVLRLNPTDFPVGSPQRIVFTKAVQDWRCITGANLTIGKDTTITAANPIMNDGVSYVFFAPSTDFLGFTQPWAEYCSTDITSLKEADMQFSSTLAPYSFAYDTNTTHNIPVNQYDFYETCTHELGHYIGLEHNVIATDLMYYSETAGNAASIRKHLVATTSADDGGTYSVNHSITVLSNPGNCWVAMALGSCSNPFNGINQYSHNVQMLIYPNPANDNINIESTASNELGTVTIYNILGEVVYSQTTKENKTQIDVSQQASGVYLIKVQNQIIKLIKQ